MRVGNAISMSRRRFLVRGAATLGSALILTPGDDATAAPTLATYALDPEWGATDVTCPADESARSRRCHGCAACHNHAANRLFATPTAADLDRAHPGCRCLVVAATHLPYDTWVGLFGLPEAIVRPSVDRRVQWVHDLLASAAGTPGSMAPAPTRPADETRELQAPLLDDPFRVTRFRVGRMGRELLIQVDAKGSAGVGVRLMTPEGLTVASRSLRLVEGRNLRRLRLPRRLHAGRYAVELSPPAGPALRRPFVVRS